MTPEQHAVDLCLRLSAIKPESEDDIANLLKWSFERAVNEERARFADALDALGWSIERLYDAINVCYGGVAREDVEAREAILNEARATPPKTAEGRSE